VRSPWLAWPSFRRSTPSGALPVAWHRPLAQGARFDVFVEWGDRTGESGIGDPPAPSYRARRQFDSDNCFRLSLRSRSWPGTARGVGGDPERLRQSPILNTGPQEAELTASGWGQPRLKAEPFLADPIKFVDEVVCGSCSSLQISPIA
jgi:hypothetical protein